MRKGPSRRQTGMALIVSLVLLLSMTLLALAAIQNTSLEERMAGNVRAENIAFQAAESALRTGEAWLESQTVPPTAAAGPVWLKTLVPQGSGCTVANLSWWLCWGSGDWNSAELVDDISLLYVSTPSTALPDARRPRYLIEEDGFQRTGLVIGQQQDVINQGNRFRITARGLDAGGRAEVLLQSRFVRRF